MMLTSPYKLKSKSLLNSNYFEPYLTEDISENIPTIYGYFLTERPTIKELGGAGKIMVDSINEIGCESTNLIIDTKDVTELAMGSVWSIVKAADGANIYTDERVNEVVIVLPQAAKARTWLQNIVKFALTTYRFNRNHFVDSTSEAVKILQEV